MRHAERLRGSRTERQVGRFAGFSVFVADNFMGGPEIVLKGAGTHLAKIGTTALGTMRSVEYAIQNLDEVAVGVENRIAEVRQRIIDLAEQADQPFEYEDRLGFLQQRQQEIAESLDLTKNQAAGPMAAESADPSPQAEGDNEAEPDCSTLHLANLT